MSAICLSLVVLRCDDIELGARFYTALGLEMVREQHEGGPVHYAAQVGRTVLELYPAAAQPARSRIGLMVDDPEEAAARALAVGGTRVESDVPNEVRLRDPAGNTVHLRPPDGS